MTTRGILNDNPCNIVRTHDNWLGLRPLQTDPRFCQFETPVWGMRAAFICIRHLVDAGRITYAGLIHAWAPPVENDTSSYVADVCGRLGVDPGKRVNCDSMGDMVSLLQAIIIHENGTCPYEYDVIGEAYEKSILK
ncbi:structural protein [Gluconobacter phage GC1]|uniref:Structural protein n=1 Tax=Gluconobacter phage GC1 TaxID=2047788 RepID=A0A2I5AR85_9VIRU|nr:endolysin [Gluconobacter phage GC1]ATS92591.1 structural protein [Gluconobacter phage GC1]